MIKLHLMTFTRRVFILILLITSVVQSYSQDLPRLAQYMFNRQVYNPAAVGTGEATLNASLLYRIQWVGVEGAPRYYGAWGDYRFTKKRMAVGVNVNHSSYSIVRNTDFLANYAYQIPLTKKIKLSMGLRAGISSNNVGSDPARFWDQNDPYVNSLNSSSTSAKFGAGLHLYSSKFYAGFAAPDFYVGGNQVLSNSNNRNYIAYAGGAIKLNDTYRLLPSTIFYANPAFSSRLDGTILVEIKDYVWAGASASTAGQFSFIAGTHISSRVRLSYAYEIAKPGSSGSFSTHEINLRFAVDHLFKK